MTRPSVRTPSTSKIIIRTARIRCFSSPCGAQIFCANVTSFESGIFTAHNVKYPDKALDQPGCLFQPKRIRAVAKGLVRFRVGFDEYPMRSGRHCRPSQGRDKAAL